MQFTASHLCYDALHSSSIVLTGCHELVESRIPMLSFIKIVHLLKSAASFFLSLSIIYACLASNVYSQTEATERLESVDSTEVSYSNGNVTLAATLIIPEGSGPFPAAVVIHGSGKSDRTNPWSSAYVQALVRRGIAVLYPDKRGSGKSKGDWLMATFLDLADDAIAGVEFLRKSPRINQAQIGVIGFSQGGHVVPAAASRTTHIAFAITISASTVPMMEQIMDEVEMGAERAGLKERQIAVINEVNRKAINYFLTGKGEKEYFAALSSAKKGELKGTPQIERFPAERDHPARTFIKTIGNFDPMTYWKRTSVPILFVYAGTDTQIRIQKSIDRIESTLGENGNNYVVLLFRRNGHALFREDLLDFIGRWISLKGAN